LDEETESLLAKLEEVDDPDLLQFVPDVERNNALLEGLPVAVLLRDLDNGKVLGLNSSCRALIGAERDELVGKTLTECGVDLLRTGMSGRVAAPGDPVKVTVIDSNKTKIPCLMFRRRLEVGLRKIEATVLVESRMLGDRTYRGGKNERLYSGALQSASPGHLLCQLEFPQEDDPNAQAPTDMLLIEAKGLFDDTISGRITVGDSISDVFPFPICRAMMGAAGQSLKSGGPVGLEIEGLGTMTVLAEKPSTAMFCILPLGGSKNEAEPSGLEDVPLKNDPEPEEEEDEDYSAMADELFGSSPESDEESGLEEREEEEKEEVEEEEEEIIAPPAVTEETAQEEPPEPPPAEKAEPKADTAPERRRLSDALFVCLDMERGESQASMLGMLGFDPVAVSSVEEAASALEGGQGRFAFVVADVGMNDVAELAPILSGLKDYHLIIMADEETSKKLGESGVELSIVISSPYSINDLAEAISEIYH
jgi:hypothetical protein